MSLEVLMHYGNMLVEEQVRHFDTNPQT